MRAFLTLVLRDLRQHVTDRAVLLFAVVIPMVLSAVFMLAFSGVTGAEPEPTTVAVSAPDGDEAAQAFDALCRHCLAGRRRPLMRHGHACPCLGTDEAAFARLVQTATEGEREDALMLACGMVRHDLAPAVVHLAQAAGLALAWALAAQGRPARLH